MPRIRGWQRRVTSAALRLLEASRAMVEAGEAKPGGEVKLKTLYIPQFNKQGDHIFSATQDVGKFVVDASNGKGVAFRNSNHFEDRHTGAPGPVWGSVIEGDLQDGWLEVLVDVEAAQTRLELQMSSHRKDPAGEVALATTLLQRQAQLKLQSALRLALEPLPFASRVEVAELPLYVSALLEYYPILLADAPSAGAAPVSPRGADREATVPRRVRAVFKRPAVCKGPAVCERSALCKRLAVCKRPAVSKRRATAPPASVCRPGTAAAATAHDSAGQLRLHLVALQEDLVVWRDPESKRRLPGKQSALLVPAAASAGTPLSPAMAGFHALFDNRNRAPHPQVALPSRSAESFPDPSLFELACPAPRRPHQSSRFAGVRRARDGMWAAEVVVVRALGLFDSELEAAEAHWRFQQAWPAVRRVRCVAKVSPQSVTCGRRESWGQRELVRSRRMACPE